MGGGGAGARGGRGWSGGEGGWFLGLRWRCRFAVGLWLLMKGRELLGRTAGARGGRI